MQFPTGGYTPRAIRPSRCNSGSNGYSPDERSRFVHLFYMQKSHEVEFMLGFLCIKGGALMNTTISTKKITTLGMFTAIAVVFCLLVRIPLVPSVSFLSYDPKDIIIGIAGFLYGPMSAFLVSMLSSAIELLFRGGNIIDWVMNVISTCSFICTAAFLYKKMHSKNGAFYGLVAGMAINIVAMIAWNYVMDPIYFGMPQQAVNAMLPAIALFNFLKDAINAVLLLLVYKPVSNALRQSGLVERQAQEAPSNKKSAAVVGLCVLLTAIVVALAFVNA